MSEKRREYDSEADRVCLYSGIETGEANEIQDVLYRQETAMTTGGEKESCAVTTGGSPDSDLERDIATFETMTSQQIDDELRRYGIDPQATIDAVTRLVQDKLRAHRRTARDIKAVPASPVAVRSSRVSAAMFLRPVFRVVRRGRSLFGRVTMGHSWRSPRGAAAVRRVCDKTCAAPDA